MLITLNVTRDVADVLVSSYAGILNDLEGQCETIGHCRTVWNIIWSCTITIFVCIWVAVHPNIPQPKPSFRPVRLDRHLPHRRVSWAWVCFQASVVHHHLKDLFCRQLPDMLTALGEKLAIALLALLAPEFIFVWALRQWLRARSIAEECRRAAATDNARDLRKQRRAEYTPLIAKERAEFEELKALSAEKRDWWQNWRYKTLRGRTPMAGKESEDQSTIEGGEETSKSTLHPCCEAFFTSSIQHGQQHMDSSF